MSRTKSLDPAIRITVTIPGHNAREAIRIAKRERISLSAFVGAAVKAYLIQIHEIDLQTPMKELEERELRNRSMAEDGE